MADIRANGYHITTNDDKNWMISNNALTYFSDNYYNLELAIALIGFKALCVEAKGTQ